MHTLVCRGDLKSAGVNVFGTASKKESLILKVAKGGDETLLDTEDGSRDVSSAAAYAHLVGRRVHIGWPYLREAAVTAVSDRREKILARGQRAPHGASEWGAAAQKTSHELLVTRGVDCGAVAVTIHCRACEGLVRHPDGSLQKRFGNATRRCANSCSPRTPTRARG